ncbi:leucyl/phenylalanyl-tRNA--protein transferase [Sandaracinus amylolyticus]|uniref:Leucyl/phenylalanyl-tRNA--protein transferase n=1 Tax=Sandaracinus amylolyticus TaxID=927083 RepID=A0A0F6YIC7_9BACT|nr:leucyl/phenylalanyl-tRNA--protein transferase [Sandaracinus amylolyticus]AKF06860.1 Leucyl/phenylalanyl-tRNA--protein transferase [Sandaracinus amylolyticus]
MPVYLLTKELVFPPPEGASPEGVVAIGGDLSPERLLLAYAQGIFPWPSEGMPLLWFSPEPRFVLEPSSAHVPRSLRKRAKKGDFEIRCDTAFTQVITGCKRAYRPGQRGTWITREMVRGYERLFELGYAHSIECWMNGVLAGGLYGVSLGGMFFGESMFAEAPDASKLAFATLLGNLVHWGYDLVDCQVHTEHLERFGAEDWPRKRFLDVLHRSLAKETRRGKWTFELDAVDAIAKLREG